MNSLRNKVQLIGNLGNGPEIITVEKWTKLAAISEDFLSKAQKAVIEGKLINPSYGTNEGDKGYITEIKCNELLMLGK
ncbi:MAG: single-stranded DNA-binding protein [Flavobacteriaceae bacterium]|nr:single-stranded DNA-binding protein [Flavobacteriaceae bacterium]